MSLRRYRTQPPVTFTWALNPSHRSSFFFFVLSSPSFFNGDEACAALTWLLLRLFELHHCRYLEYVSFWLLCADYKIKYFFARFWDKKLIIKTKLFESSTMFYSRRIKMHCIFPISNLFLRCSVILYFSFWMVSSLKKYTNTYCPVIHCTRYQN